LIISRYKIARYIPDKLESLGWKWSWTIVTVFCGETEKKTHTHVCIERIFSLDSNPGYPEQSLHFNGLTSCFTSFFPSFILGVFAELRKANTSFAMSVCLFVCPSVRPHGTIRLPHNKISWDLIFACFFFFDNLSTKFKFY
jgi:hypothetical protein